MRFHVAVKQLMAVSTTTRNDLQQRADKLNAKFANLKTPAIIDHLINGRVAGRPAVISSFGAEAAVLLKLVADKDPATPVVFLDTGKHFDETLRYVDDLMEQLGLSVLVRVRPTQARITAEDPDGELFSRDSDRCCYVRKTLPMISALRDYDCVMTGRKRFQTADRKEMDVAEVQESWLRINPLAGWTRDQLLEYLSEQKLLEHPLVSQGYASVGCEPCTARSSDYRAGRWAGQGKTECGIHITESGKIVRLSDD